MTYNNLENGLLRHRTTCITEELWCGMIEASPLELAMMSVIWEYHDGCATLWRVLRKHPEIINEVASNGDTLLARALSDGRSGVSYHLVQLGAQFKGGELMWHEGSRNIRAMREKIRADALVNARTKTVWVDGKYEKVPVPEEQIHPLLK
jgi:hypothetical protein